MTASTDNADTATTITTITPIARNVTGSGTGVTGPDNTGITDNTVGEPGVPSSATAASQVPHSDIMTEDGVLVTKPLRPDIDLTDPRLGMKIAAERLSIVRYVFLVQIEDGIASAAQRASLEYADAVLIGWPDEHSDEVVDLTADQLHTVREQMELMEQYIRKFSAMERNGDVDGMTDTLIRVTERVAEVRRLYQPDFALPTFAEIRRVVQDEWNEDMGKIDPQESEPTAGEIARESRDADREQEGETA
ncbi:phosphoribosylglycinamide synthetase [Bifidobacterium hapali]|uniref:Phosphoribosylglycinamide synthetase n=2 Tax=Bifidobacterium hapali TaxID=1630172 RepID=A0A261FV93_9BIFI|nr:phosphoribosylglycinamide synthetase [Bifidobacterium hapali]